MPSFSALLSVFAAVSVALASPTARATTCTPNFSGRTVSIVDNSVEWSALTATVGTEVIARATVTSPAGSKYHVEQTGSTPASYLIKDIRDTSNSLVVGVASDNTLELATLSQTSPQAWSISCSSCTGDASTLPSGATAASSCSIMQTSTGKCVDIAGSAAKGDVLYVTECTGGVSQRYSFVVA